MGRRLFLLAVPAVFVGVVVMKVLDAVSAMAYDKQLQFNDASCSLLQAPIPCEDISAFGDGHSAFAGCGDLWSTLMNGSESAKDGAIYLVNATKGDMRRLPIDFDGSALPFKLVTHGIFYSQRSMRLYAVNHDELAGESVEIFDVVGQGPSLKLRHTRTIRSPLFGNMALNDVVEGETDEIYVTEWQPFPFPSGGRAGMATAPLGVKLQRQLGALLTFFVVPVTRVFRCKVSAVPECVVATSSRFVGANGIAVSNDRTAIFVNDPPRGTISAFERNADGSLIPVSDFKIKHIVDNIEMTPEGKLSAGSIPLLYTAEVVCEDHAFSAFSATKTVNGRTVGCGKSPGGLLSVSLLGLGGSKYTIGTQEDGLMHDGSLLSGVSAALELGGNTLLGSPYSPGLLLCSSQGHGPGFTAPHR
jgi:hypothetical protein